MEQFMCTILVMLSMYVMYIWWIKPVRIIKGYVKILRSRGYKVLQVFYNPFKNDMISCLNKGKQQGDPLKMFKQQRRNYDVIVSNTLTRPRLQFHHPDFLKDYYSVEKHFQFPKTDNVTKVYERIAGRGLIFIEAEHWRKHRSLLNKIFNFDFIKSQCSKIAQICNESLAQVQNQSRKNQDSSLVTYNILKYTVKVFSNVMIRSFIGGQKNLKIGDEQAAQFLRKLLSEMYVQAFAPLNFILGPKFLKIGLTKRSRDIKKRIQYFRQWGLSYIQKRVNKIKEYLENNPNKLQHKNIIQAFVLSNIEAQKQNKLQDIITNQQIFQQFTAFFIAGTDTTANFTQMMIYEIARHPEIQTKVRLQIQKYIKDESSQNYNELQNYSHENLKNLTYIQLVQKEVTRTYGPLNLLFSRKAKGNIYLNGLPIKKGTGISIFNFSNHYSQKYFKNPKQFRPQRWIDQCKDIPPFVIGGFSAGARTCLGKHLALLQSKIALIKFMKKYNKIILPKQNFIMVQKFMYAPEQFQSTMIINDKNCLIKNQSQNTKDNITK